jgi:succinylglutamate desuccinylase
MIQLDLEPKSKIPIHRVLYCQNNYAKGLTLICIGAIHGNEPAGIKGLQNVISQLIKNNIALKGNFYALIGNKSAYKKRVRFQDLDLNRLWTKNDIDFLNSHRYFTKQEHKEQYELYDELKSIMTAHDGPFVFIDLHTTSSPTQPFITISDSLNNRYLAKKFNVPIVLGIEEYLDGPLLSYINEFGHTSLGFEAGQHDDKKSILHCEAFVWLIMQKLKLVTKDKFSYNIYSNLLNFEKGFYEIIYRYALKNKDEFRMHHGFNNFNAIRKNQILATNKTNVIKSPSDGLIFMPLYQNQGTDGFFIVRNLSKIWLLLSSVLRGLKFHNLLKILPGISAHPEQKYGLIANKKIAAFLTTKVFHLFGYRKQIKYGDRILFVKRDREISHFA